MFFQGIDFAVAIFFGAKNGNGTISHKNVTERKEHIVWNCLEKFLKFQSFGTIILRDRGFKIPEF